MDEIGCTVRSGDVLHDKTRLALAMGSDAARRIAIERADALFGQRVIDDIHAIEKATRVQIDEKRTKLRALVGESYKEVIRSADAILEIASLAQEVLEHVDEIHAQLRERPPMETPKRREDSKGGDEALHVMGSRVKYLLDSQEVIWSALDAGDYLEAARRLLRAEVVYEGLERWGKAAMITRFPFVEHQWPSVVQLKTQILDAVQQHVVGTTVMQEIDAKLVLTTVATLTPMSSLELLQTYLQWQKLNALNLAATHFGTQLPPAEVLSQIGTLLEETMLHVIHLFLKLDLEAAGNAIHQEIAQDAIGFGGSLIGALGDVAEQDRWDENVKERQRSFDALSISDTSEALQEWLKDVAQIVRESGESLLLSCVQLTELVSIEGAVKETLSNASIRQAVQESLGIEVDLWKSVFEAVLQEKCLSIIAVSFREASTELQSQLEASIEKMSKRESEPLGHITVSTWKLRAHKFNTFNADESVRSDALQLVTQFDVRLRQILEEVSAILDVRNSATKEGEQHSPTASVKHGSLRSFSLLSGTHHRGAFVRRTERSTQLEPKIQTLWEETALHLAGDLDRRLAELPNCLEIEIVEVALFVGTVATGLAENCPCMGLLAGPVEEWRPDAIPRSARSSVKAEPPSMSYLSNAFLNVAFRGIEIWTQWAVEHLVMEWMMNVRFGKLMGSEHLQEITISHQVTEAEDNSHMRFSIPCAPSEPTVQLLTNASSELQRLGFYCTQTQILRLFQFKLEAAIRDALQKEFLSGKTESFPDNYVLQLLLDFRFLCDVCSAGEPVSKLETESNDVQRTLSAVPEDAVSLQDTSQRKDPAVKRAVLESKKLSKSVEAELSTVLDPIDWATYEPHLWMAERRSYRRTELFFGTIGFTSQNLHADIPVKLPPGAETNCLRAAPVTSRFQYLPVRSTTALDKGPRSASLVNAAALIEQEEDPNGSYSFSDFGHSIGTREQSGGSSLQALDVGSFTSLGTIFTDKAAEMSALAQQRFEQFGDYLQPSSLASSSIFSSFAKRVGPTSGARPS